MLRISSVGTVLSGFQHDPRPWLKAMISPIRHQRWQFRVIGDFNKLPRIAKTLLHEMDLKVTELVLSDAAKGVRKCGLLATHQSLRS